jgi:hypothetical protein
LGITPISLHVGGVQHTVGLHLNRRFVDKVMGPQRCDSNFGNFGTPTWESRDKNAIWMLVSWPSIEYTIRGKVMASPKSGPWWVLWIWVCPWFVLAPKVLKLCTNQLVVWFCAGSCEWLKCLSIFVVPSWNSNTPLYHRSAANHRTCLNFLLFRCFHLRLTFASFEEVGSASQ